ncbi:MAG: LPS export ABC transporter periplasmic protein LptC [Bacteroidales bacterium]
MKLSQRILFLQAIPLVLLLSSCERKIEKITKSDIESLPSQVVKDFVTTYTDSAKKQLVMSSPLLEYYSNHKPVYSEFRLGINVIFYDGKPEPVGTLSSKYARFEEVKKLWELKDSVIAINEKKEKLETELLYWDQDKNIVYTDRFVKITSEDQVIMGTGLESDPRFTKWKIRNVSAQFYLNEK